MQAARTGLALKRLARDRAQRPLGELQCTFSLSNSF